MHSNGILRQIGKQIRTNFEITSIPTPMRSWIIALGIRRQLKDTPYRRSRAGDKLFHKIHAQVVTRTSTVKRDRENSIKYENLIRIKTITSAMIPKAYMSKLSHINPRSICNKIPSLHHSICENSNDICSFQDFDKTG